MQTGLSLPGGDADHDVIARMRADRDAEASGRMTAGSPSCTMLISVPQETRFKNLLSAPAG